MPTTLQAYQAGSWLRDIKALRWAVQARKAVKEHVRKYEKADDSQAWLTVAITIGVYVLSLCTYPLWKYPLLYYACAIFRGMVGVRYVHLTDGGLLSYIHCANEAISQVMAGPITR